MSRLEIIDDVVQGCKKHAVSKRLAQQILNAAFINIKKAIK